MISKFLTRFERSTRGVMAKEMSFYKGGYGIKELMKIDMPFKKELDFVMTLENALKSVALYSGPEISSSKSLLGRER